MINNPSKYRYVIIMLLVMLSVSGIKSSSEESIDDQVTSISNLLMCPVCQGQSVGESNSNLAHDMRDIVRKQLEQGKTKDEILAYFVSSYGESILASPPPKGINWLLWLLPGAGIIVGGIVITMFLFRAQKEDRSDISNEIDSKEANDEYLKRIDEEIKNRDP